MIAVVGLDHHQASVDARGRLSFSGDRLADSLRALGDDPRIDEVVILSTCNRTEVYLSSQRLDEALAQVGAFLAENYERMTPQPAVTGAATTRGSTRPALALEEALYTREGLDAAAHLYQVAAGLRSMVIGEPQILGQVREALVAAQSAGVVDDALRTVFTGAIKIGKRVRAETNINRADISVAGLGLRVAREALGGLSDKTALLIGAGRTSQLSAELLRAEGIGEIIVANRTTATAAALAQASGARAIELDAITPAIARADLIISATAAPFIVLEREAIAHARADAAHPLVIVDLAVPADVEASAATLPRVTLYTLDSLRDQADPDARQDPAVVASLRGHERDIAAAEQIIAEGMREYTRTQTMRLAAPSIATLRRHVDLSAEQELARAMGQLGHLSDADKAIIERLSERLVDKMFHHLVRRIRALAEYDEIPPDVTMRVLAQLFAETTPPPASTGERRP